jgi:alanine racemase
VPFTDDASIENAINCWCLMIYLGYEDGTINDRFKQLHKVEMRLQLVHAINNCVLINDSYSADLTSLQFALQFLVQQSAGLKRTVIISDFFQSGKDEKELYAGIVNMLISHGIEKVIAIGEKIGKYLSPALSDSQVELYAYPDTESFVNHFKSSRFLNETILVKGARLFRFEEIVMLFEEKRHQTVLEINLNALADNLKEYKRLLKPSTKLMAMVKAFSYGSGGAEIASVLQFNNVDYLGVAYADEGVELVKSGITLPIMVMNAEASSFAAIVEYNLQPVIFSFELLYAFESYLDDQ